MGLPCLLIELSNKANKTFNKPYLGVGVSLMYKQLFATLATDATKLDSDVVFVESRLTLGYRF
ncbi:hypothetical protein KW450_03060 [Vibrio fluvialis]|nr:hypothetical protein [Vibrio fluvialis]